MRSLLVLLLLQLLLATLFAGSRRSWCAFLRRSLFFAGCGEHK